jgi:hypothetical protein
MLTMILKGKPCEVEGFATHLKAQPFIEMISESWKDQAEVELHFATNIFKPTIPKVCYVVLETTDGQTIQIEMLGPVESRVKDQVTQIKGYSYDIFATPT